MYRLLMHSCTVSVFIHIKIIVSSVYSLFRLFSLRFLSHLLLEHFIDISVTQQFHFASCFCLTEESKVENKLNKQTSLKKLYRKCVNSVRFDITQPKE